MLSILQVNKKKLAIKKPLVKTKGLNLALPNSVNRHNFLGFLSIGLLRFESSKQLEIY